MGGHQGMWVGVVDEHNLCGARGGNLRDLVEALGKRSAAAQGLRKPVTTCSMTGQRLFLLVSGRTAFGLLKVGVKTLFVSTPASRAGGGTGVRDALRQINPLCALDFYVHESCQRNGFGKQIFEAMLEQEGLEAWQLAYDRPSPKFLAFLSKYYGLSRYQPQNNNFVVFEDFFESDKGQGRTRSVTQSRRSATESSGAERPLEQDMTHLSPRQRMLKRQASEARPLWIVCAIVYKLRSPNATCAFPCGTTQHFLIPLFPVSLTSRAQWTALICSQHRREPSATYNIQRASADELWLVRSARPLTDVG